MLRAILTMHNRFVNPALPLLLLCVMLAWPLSQNEQTPAHADTPASIALVVDNSKSMSDKMSKVVEAMVMFVKASNPQNEYFVINFNDDAYLDQDFTQDSEKVILALRRAKARSGTALNDALVASADHLIRSAQYKRKILILVGDGFDNESRAPTSDMLNRFKKPDAPMVFAIGLFRSGQTQRGKKVFETLANETGGAMFLADNPQKLNEIMDKMVKQIRSH